MRSSDKNVFWSENGDGEANSIVGMLQKYTDKTVTTFKASAIVAHPVHVVFLNFTKHFRWYLIDHGNTPVGLPSILAIELLLIKEMLMKLLSIESF